VFKWWVGRLDCIVVYSIVTDGGWSRAYHMSLNRDIVFGWLRYQQ